MKPMPTLMETELESFGAATVEDLTWKQLLDTDACTMCGRCTSVCPAHATGKPLDPREIVLKTGEVMARTGTPPVSPPRGVDPEITIGANSLFERITSEEVWACTTCKACDEICPVNIEILDKILDMRRYLSLMESDFPVELGNTYRSMENTSNVYGMNQGERADWSKDLYDVPIVDGSGKLDHEYLMWVGCAGSFDDRNKKTTRARSCSRSARSWPRPATRRSARRSAPTPRSRSVRTACSNGSRPTRSGPARAARRATRSARSTSRSSTRSSTCGVTCR
jgi:heterodisulfide reductase subunit C